MKARIRKIGNSQGIILPKEIIEQCQFQDEVELRVSENKLIVEAPAQSRSSWEEAFIKASAQDEGVLDNADLIENEFDKNEWEW